MNQKDALLRGAKKCLIEKGYGRTTARDITEASGAHLGSIGYHYGSKDRLMSLAALELSSEWGDTISEALHEAKGATPRARLGTVLATIRASLPETRDVQSASLQAFVQSQFDDTLREHLAAGGANARREFGALLADQTESTTDLSAPQSALGALAHALTLGVVVQYLVEPDSLPTANEMRAALDLLCDGEEER
ncbi:TetR/AcrR family transcriptional regulator [Spiractinospora alimapuensis]|uniref:TetR/AcrR family transcriptional regulator n=1 Tax=Spiractinospora alimapuensis TaxID=2820884 RepID=UPI001F468CC9|nr:TetR/AcrR family transcriptional regulator [Spiractinospora alimapuensis]QVQ50070.1 TetR/AcrR family transcriptional regulator [Spiractinospora alimapuensis]